MYTVKILSSEEFDKLPFTHAKEALGAADPSTNIAYVRDTGYNDITKHTIEHELDELLQKTSPHEIDGIRYKIPVIGPLFSAAGTGLSALGSGIGKVAGAVGSAAGKIPGIGGAIQSGVQGLGSVASAPFNLLGSGASAIGNIGTAARAAGTGAGVGSTAPIFGAGVQPASTFGFGAGVQPPSAILSPASTGGGIADLFKRAGTQFLTGLGNTFQQQPTSKYPGFPNTPPIVPPSDQGQGGSGNLLDTIFKSAGQNAIPAAIGLLGDLLAPKPGELDVSGITGGLRDRISGDAVSPLFEAGSRELLSDLSSITEAPPEAAFARGDQIIQEDLDDQIENLRNQFKALNPNANVENNTAFLAEKSRLEERARERRAQVRDEVSFQYVREQLNRDLQEIQTALSLDSAQTEQLIAIAQMDAEALSLNYRISLEEARAFKNLFGRYGQLLGQ